MRGFGPLPARMAFLQPLLYGGGQLMHIVYLFSDWIIRTIEEKRGDVLKQRQVVFLSCF